MTPCPSCGTPVAGQAGAEVVCPACFTAFTTAEAPATAFDVMLIDGTRHDAINRWLVRERVYTGRYPPTARLSPSGRNEWAPIHEVDELAALYALVGAELPLATGTRRIAGWRGADGASPRPRGGGAPGPSPAHRPDRGASIGSGTSRPASRVPAPVVAEGTTARLVASGVEEELELEVEPSEPAARPTSPPPAPSPPARNVTVGVPRRSYLPYLVAGLAAVGLGLALVLIAASTFF